MSKNAQGMPEGESNKFVYDGIGGEGGGGEGNGLLNPTNPQRIFIAISAVGAFRRQCAQQ